MKRIITLIVVMFACLATSTAQNPFYRGAGDFIYTNYEPLKDKPVKVYFYIPTKGDIATMRVLFSMHGAERSGKIARDNWQDLAEADGFVVIAPEFSSEFYKENDYQFGGVYTDKTFTELRPREQWTYSIIEPLFDYFVYHTNSLAEKYDMQGHSAGGQWTHRFLLATPQARVNVAVAANPGSWTFPLNEGEIADFGFPYSIKNSPFADEEHLKAFFARKMYVCLGNLDTATKGAHVPTDAASLSQGKHRYERGKNLFATAKAEAKRLKMDFNWQMSVVDGVGHQGRSIIYGKWRAGSNNQRVFDVDYVTRTGAYYLIYRKN